MPLENPVHRDRDRAESFGAVADDYDRYRPSYPSVLIDDLLRPRPRSVLDIGTGTGKAARLLAARGVPVLGVEIDPLMAAVARDHGIAVEVAGFEEWDDRGRTFDLIISGQAWHWVDPAVAAPKAARLLTPRGRLVLFWNYEEPEDATQRISDAVYAEYAPELASTPEQRAQRKQDRPSAAGLRKAGVFGSISERTYPWRIVLPVDEWIGRLGTHSEHLVLGEARRATLLAALRSALSAAGPELRLHGGTYTITAQP